MNDIGEGMDMAVISASGQVVSVVMRHAEMTKLAAGY
jgi:hypothetical protein